MGNMPVSSETVRLVRVATDIEKMKKVFSDLEILATGAVRTSRAYDPSTPAFSSEDCENFLNNLPGLIAVFKAVELQLLMEGIFLPLAANDRIKPILRDIVEAPAIADEEIRSNPNIFADIVKQNQFWAVRITMANATWATRATTRVESDGTRLKRVSRVNSILELISPWLPKESEDERFKRLREVVKDLDQLRAAAQWWLDVLADPEKLLAELAEIRQITRN